MCTHQTAIRAVSKELTCSRAGCGLRLPSLSLLCSPLWFLLQLLLLMSLPASDRPWWTGPGRCAGLQGCRVGHQTGSHTLCGTESSQKGHSRAARSRDAELQGSASRKISVCVGLIWERIAMCNVFLCMLICLLTTLRRESCSLSLAPWDKENHQLFHVSKTSTKTVQV